MTVLNLSVTGMDSVRWIFSALGLGNNRETYNNRDNIFSSDNYIVSDFDIMIIVILL